MKYFSIILLLLTLAISLAPKSVLADGLLGPGNCFLGLMECGASETVIEINTPGGDPDATGSFENRVDSPSTEFSRTTTNREDGIAGYIIRIIIFINLTLIPLLFGIALLFFLFNIVRYFINSGNVAEREKASRAALFGIAAFVFLVSIWGIVNLFVNGLDFDREDPICPDYLGRWCNDGSFGTPDNPITVTPPALVDFGDGSGEPVIIDGSGDDDFSGLAELIYGAAMDRTEISFNPGLPRSQNNTPQIAQDTSCTAGISTLQQAANREANQAVYAVYTTADGTTAWTNLTDGNRDGRLIIDGDTITSIEAAGATDIRIVQMQPKQIADSVGLALRGYGPSTADYSLLCDNLIQDFPLITVDWNGVWRTENENSLACPRRTADIRDLPLIDALYAVSLLPAGQRNDEYDKLLASDLVPFGQRSDLADFDIGDLNSFTPAEIRSLADGVEIDVELMSNRVGAAAACQISNSVLLPPANPPTPEEIVRDAIAATLGIDTETVSIVNLRTTTWPDGCLGLATTGEVCTQATVPGFDIVLNIGGDQRTFHTNNDGSIFRERLGDTGNQNTSLNTTAASVLENIARNRTFSVPIEQIQIIDIARAGWSDSCLGLEVPGDICGQAFVSGFILTIVDGPETLRFHTNTDGTVFREDIWWTLE